MTPDYIPPEIGLPVAGVLWAIVGYIYLVKPYLAARKEQKK
ncbi:hypothetical protein FDJ44_gp49 [Microbacterium phage Pikmin]|uniref:Uncharacterized protein n=3 Tax=Pikminvirus pikmin TaxID=2560596 RepID=A0A2P1CL71_9CAUD|nr:hypothetical protein FDJ44_gp49 [Microbacterium phage Pikmin]AVJ51040.1 hypothetical protein PBI_PAJAZA_49 [Microbacterium phage Pajaza]AVJ51187.1 hypothetical protein PBI_PIKMIN_49 [Microbacterium phage Pikmin]AVJ51745.1 hypothetical protein PBI_CASEY_49 [Microbacterium phage Casey]